MSQWQPPRPTEIDKKLRDDFRRLLKEYGVTTEETDPILAVLLRSFAAQIAEVYEQAAESIPMRKADPATAHLFIVNPLSGRSLAGLFSTHPPLEKRIERLLSHRG